MNIKLIPIKACKHCTEVLLVRQRGEDGNDYVQIIAWHKDEDGNDYIQTENIGFEEHELIGRFIADFTEFSANTYANKYTF